MQEITDMDVASSLANGHPKSSPSPLHDAHPFPANSTGAGSAPGANGPPTTGPVTPDEPAF